MGSVVETFVGALGARLVAALPEIDGRVSYLYRTDASALLDVQGMPSVNLLWLGETHRPASNQFGGLAFVDGQLQADMVVPMTTPNASGLVDGAILWDAAASLRVAIVEAFHAHTGGSPIGAFDWLDLGDIVTDFGVLRSAMGQDVGMICIRPTVRLRRAYNGR